MPQKILNDSVPPKVLIRVHEKFIEMLEIGFLTKVHRPGYRDVQGLGFSLIFIDRGS